MKKLLTEHEEQVIVVQWARANGIPVFSVPNGAMLGGRNKFALLNKLKAEGFSSGVPDLIFPCNKIAVEMKRQKGGVVSPEQMVWLDVLSRGGWQCLVCRGADDAIAKISIMRIKKSILDKGNKDVMG